MTNPKSEEGPSQFTNMDLESMFDFGRRLRGDRPHSPETLQHTDEWVRLEAVAGPTSDTAHLELAEAVLRASDDHDATSLVEACEIFAMMGYEWADLTAAIEPVATYATQAGIHPTTAADHIATYSILFEHDPDDADTVVNIVLETIREFSTTAEELHTIADRVGPRARERFDRELEPCLVSFAAKLHAGWSTRDIASHHE